MSFYVDINRTLILVYVLSFISCAYLLCLNDIIRGKMNSENLACCLLLSLIPILNLSFAIHAGVDNIIYLCKYHK